MNKIVTSLCLIFLFISCFSNTVAIVDNTKISANDIFQLSVTTDQRNATLNLNNVKAHFIIINVSPSEMTTSINGKTSFQKAWSISLKPKKTGTFTIPAFKLAGEQTKPIVIHVLDQQQLTKQGVTQPIELKAEVDTKTPYVQSQVLYTLKLLFAVNLSNNAQLTDPSSNNAIIMQIGKDQLSQTRVNGKLYRVLQRTYAIFPQTSGKISINPPVFNGYIVKTRNSRFGGMMSLFPRSGSPVQASAPEITLNVKSIPSIAKSATWLPTANLSIKQNWTAKSGEFKVGKPVTRTITITAKGITAAQLPSLPNQQLTDANTYQDKPELNNIVENNQVIGVRTEKVAYVPTKSGIMQIPAIEINWFNTKTNKMEVSRLAAETIKIQPGTLSTPISRIVFFPNTLTPLD